MRKLYFKYFDRISIRKKLFLSYMIICVTPVILFGWYYISRVMKSYEEDAMIRSLHDIRQISSNVSRNIEICNTAGQIAMNVGGFLDILSTEKKYSVLEMLNFRDNELLNVETITNVNISIHKLRFFIKNEYVHEIYPCLRYESLIAQEKWYPELFERDGMIYYRLNHYEDDFLPPKTRTDEVVSLYKVVRYRNSYVGVLEVSMKADVFFGNGYADASKSSFICIIKDKSEQYWNRASSFFSQYDLDPAEIKDMLITHATEQDGTFKLKHNGFKLGVSYSYISAINSYAFEIISLDTISREFKNLQTATITIVVVAVLVYSLITYFITTVIFKKMKLIIGYMRRVQGGEMFVDIPVLGGDEIGELSMHFKLMLNKINELMFSVMQKQNAAKNAEIQALLSQINAHFIYNVLESIKMMAVVEYKYEIADAITSLGRLIRYNINWRHQYVFLEDEITHIKNYINLLNLRFNNGINLIIEIPTKLFRYQLLKMLIQPLVENAVNHGLAPKGNKGTIVIYATEAEDKLEICVQDNGTGMTKEALSKLRESLETGIPSKTPVNGGNGIGLKNVNERIRLIYGSEFGIWVDSCENYYTKVCIRIPPCTNKRIGDNIG